MVPAPRNALAVRCCTGPRDSDTPVSGGFTPQSDRLLHPSLIASYTPVCEATTPQSARLLHPSLTASYTPSGTLAYLAKTRYLPVVSPTATTPVAQSDYTRHPQLLPPSPKTTTPVAQNYPIINRTYIEHNRTGTENKNTPQGASGSVSGGYKPVSLGESGILDPV